MQLAVGQQAQNEQQPGSARRSLHSSSAAAAGQQSANASTLADAGKPDATAQCDEVRIEPQNGEPVATFD